MHIDDLLKQILRVLPNASIGEDLDGQVVIYTNSRLENGFLEDMDDCPPDEGSHLYVRED